MWSRLPGSFLYTVLCLRSFEARPKGSRAGQAPSPPPQPLSHNPHHYLSGHSAWGISPWAVLATLPILCYIFFFQLTSVVYPGLDLEPLRRHRSGKVFEKFTREFWEARFTLHVSSIMLWTGTPDRTERKETTAGFCGCCWNDSHQYAFCAIVHYFLRLQAKINPFFPECLWQVSSHYTENSNEYQKEP